MKLINFSSGILTRMLVLCVAINFWGCAPTYNPQYTHVSESDINEGFKDYVRRQTEMIELFKGREIKEFMLENPIKFEERTAVPDALGGYLYTIRVRPPIPRIQESRVNQYGSTYEILEYVDIVYNLFVNSTGILEQIKVDFRAYDIENVDKLSDHEKKLIRDNERSTLAGYCLVGIAIGVLLVVLDEPVEENGSENNNTENH